MPDITVDKRTIRPDVSVHVEDTGGTGRPVVLIHGWPLSGASWSEQVPALTSAGYRVITYDRRGFGQSDKPKTGYDYDTLAGDLDALLTELDLRDVTLVGFSMGGGEVARPLEPADATKMTASLTADKDAFFDQFTTDFFSVDGELKVTDEQRQEAIALCQQADKVAVLEAMQSFGISDFREDLPKVTVPTLVVHGDGDGTVPFEGSGARTHAAIPHSELHVISGGPHGINVSHADELNRVLVDFLSR